MTDSYCYYCPNGAFLPYIIATLAFAVSAIKSAIKLIKGERIATIGIIGHILVCCGFALLVVTASESEHIGRRALVEPIRIVFTIGAASLLIYVTAQIKQIVQQKK